MTPTVQMRRLRLIQVVICFKSAVRGAAPAKVPLSTDWLQQETPSQLQELEVCTDAGSWQGWSL